MVPVARIELATSPLPRECNYRCATPATPRVIPERPMNARGECAGDLDRAAPGGYGTGMATNHPSDPAPGGPTRAERLAAALRANLHRRKARARALRDGAGPMPDTTPEADAGAAPGPSAAGDGCSRR